MGLFSRRAPWVTQKAEPAGAKAAEFSPEFIETVRSLGWAWGSYGAMYRTQPAVRACVDFLARNIAQLNPKVFERVGDTDRLEVGDHRLARLLRRPNPDTTRYRHLYATVADLAIYDRAFWRVVEGGRALLRIAPERLTLETRDGVTVYRLPDGTEVPRRELVIFRGYSPADNELGVSPMETLRQILLEEQAAVTHREGFWRNAARQSGWIERPLDAPQWSVDARNRFRTDMEQMVTGRSNSGRIGVLEEGMKWNGTSFSPKESLYIEGRMLTRKEVAIQYGISPTLVGAGTDTMSNVEANHRHLYQDTLGPWLRMLQDEIELQLLPIVEPMNARSTVYVEFNLAEKLRGSFEEQQKALTTAVGVPHMSVNEGRARVNLPRIDEEWADVPVQPLNVMYGGQPATTVPTADPGTLSAREAHMKALAKAEGDARDEAAEAGRSLLVAFFERQEQSVASAFAGKTLSARDRARWDRELAANLYTQSVTTASAAGRRAAGQIDGVYDDARTRDYLLANANSTAEGINETTFDALEAAEDLDEVRHVFEVAKTSRAEALGLSLATFLVGFARVEAGRHSQDADGRVRTKTWVVTAQNSRHPYMNGETVPVQGDFSNGGRWPGDPGLGADESAGCSCLLQMGVQA